jgi:hypothetical protein
MKLHQTALKLALPALLLGTEALAYRPIIRDFNSVRTAGMGNVRYTVGQFEENFFANPARSTENPENLLQLPQLSFETSSGTLNSIKDLIDSGDGLAAFQNSMGKPLSVRTQMVFPAYFSREFFDEKMSFGIGAFFSAQMIPIVSQSGQIQPTTAITAGPVINLARRFLEEDRLSIGINVRTQVRASSNSAFSIQEFLSGTDFSSAIKGGSGLGIDGDIGARFHPHWGLGGFRYEVAAAINNVLGGKYTNLGRPISSWAGDPYRSKTSFNFGISAKKTDAWIFDHWLLAMETTDIGNNDFGSFYRTLHFGTEAAWSVFRLRGGINQGYFTAGLGIDLAFLQLNVATYGEELGLNPGVLEDRRYALQLGFQI